MVFEEGTVVWVNLKRRLWWVGQVTNEYPEDLLARHKTEPIAVVKFFSEDEYLVVKKPAEILPYNCDKREEFIKRGKQQTDKKQLEKFIADCKQAESLTGGKEEAVDTLTETAHSVPKKPVYAELFKQTPPPPPKPTPVAGLLKLNFKKPGSPSKTPTPQLVEGKKYKCDQCTFTCDRLNVYTSHRKTHTASSSSVEATLTPAKPKSPIKASSLEITPKKLGSPTKSPPGKRGRKRKAGKESAAPPEADKLQILADWSDEGENPESPNPLVEDREPKKPRTEKELSDAFESLLSKTKPSELVDVEPILESGKSDADDRSDDDEFFGLSTQEDIGEELVGTEELKSPVEESTEAPSVVGTLVEIPVEDLVEKVESTEIKAETEIKEEVQPEPVPKSNPTAKVIGVCKVKVIESPTDVKPEASEPTEKEGIDDAEELQNEVDALLAATLPIELNHEQLFATRPDLQYKVSPVQLKSDISLPVSLAPTSPIPSPATSPQQQITSSPPRGKKTQPPPASPSKSVMAEMVPTPISTAEVHPIPQPTLITQAVTIKSHPPGQVLLKSGALKITKAPPPSIVKEKIVVIHSDASKVQPGQVQQQQIIPPIMVPQAVKVYSPYPVTSSISSPVVTPVVKKGRAKKQTLTEREGVIPSTPPQTLSQVGKLTSLTPAQLMASSPLGAKIHPASVQTVQSLQTKVHALPVASGGLRGATTTTGTGMVRLSTTASQIHQQQRAASPAILAKSGTQFKYQRQSVPTYAPSTAASTSHYQIVTSTTGTGQAGNVLISQPAQPRFMLTSLAAGTSQVSHLMSSAQKKRAPIKKAVPGPAVVKLPEVAKPLPKPTAAIKPTLSEEEQLSSAKNEKIRQALIAGQKAETIVAAEKVVHLLPVQNQDGTVTYMLIHLDDVGGGVRIDQAEGPPIHGNVDPIYVESEVRADKLLATIIHQNSKPVAPKKVTNRKSPAPKTSVPVSPRGKAPLPTTAPTTQTLVIPGDQIQLQKQAAQPRQVVIGQQQQHVSQVQGHRQPSTSQHLQHQTVQAQKQAPMPSYHVVQKQTTPQQQPPQRQVFVSQPQQVYYTQQQSISTTTTHAQNETQMMEEQSYQMTVPTTFATESSTTHLEQPLQGITQQEQQQFLQKEAELQMPPLIETTKAVEGVTTQSTQPQETQQVHYIIQHGQEGEGTGGQEGNVEVPMEIQDYFQIVTGEDGTQYYITPEGMAGDQSQAYYQVHNEGDVAGVNYEYGNVEGGEEQQFLILQEDGTLVSPQSLGMDMAQVLAFQQQAQLQQQLPEGEAEVQVQDTHQPNV